MDGAADGSSPDNFDKNIFIYINNRHGLHYYLC